MYLALADIVPELHKKKEGIGQFTVTLFFLLGILLVLILNKAAPHVI